MFLLPRCFSKKSRDLCSLRTNLNSPWRRGQIKDSFCNKTVLGSCSILNDLVAARLTPAHAAVRDSTCLIWSNGLGCYVNGCYKQSAASASLIMLKLQQNHCRSQTFNRQCNATQIKGSVFYYRLSWAGRADCSARCGLLCSSALH